MAEETHWALLTPRGAPVEFTVRNGTNDGSLAYGTMHNGDNHSDEYGLRGRNLSGWAIDVGAHIGCIAVPLAIDNPGLQVIAIDVVPDNIRMLRRNVEDNGLGDRVHIVHAAAGGPDEQFRTSYFGQHDYPDYPGFAEDNRFIGNMMYEQAKAGMIGSESLRLPVVSLGALLERFGIEEVAFLKIDCEGCEWAFLADPAISRVRTIIGEYHGDYAGQAVDAERSAPVDGLTGPVANAQPEVIRLLDATHQVTFPVAHPTTGLFEAVRRG